MTLPNLVNYRNTLLDTNIHYPLNTVGFSNKGLLQAVPGIKSEKKGWPWNKQTNPEIYDININWPKLSIVTPSYNQGEFLEETIRSVLLQNYPNLEFIIIDGGSTDNSLQILEKYSQYVSYWHSEKDKGQGHAINLGFSLASGDYFGWINSDDFYNKNAFYFLGKEILNSKKEFYYGDAITVNEDRSLEEYWKANLVFDRYLRFGGLIASHSAFWSRAIHQPIWEKMNCNVDGELWIRMVKKKSRKHIPYPLGSYRIQQDAKTISASWKKKWKEDDDNIEAEHGPHNTNKKWLIYEYHYIQKLYKLFFK